MPETLSTGGEARLIRLAGGLTIAVLFMGSTLLTPLYELYRDAFGLSSLEVTQIYAVYVVGNLTALLFLGRLSDQLGRRPVVLAGMGLAAVATAFFLAATGPGWLFAGRVISGLAVGIGSGAATAWIGEALPEHRRPQAASVMTAFNFVGLALGPVVGGVLVQHAPDPLRLPMIAYLVLVAATAALVWSAAETGRRSGKIDLTLRLGVPAGKRLAFVAPAASGFAAMAVVGFYAALGSAMIHQNLGVTDHAIAGILIAELFVVAMLAILASRSLAPRPILIGALAAMPVGLGLLALMQGSHSIGLLLAGTTVAGVAAALGYRGGLSVVNAMAPEQRRAEMVSAYFACCFLGNALPVVGVGALSQAVGLAHAARIFSAALSAVALAALAAALLIHGGIETAAAPDAEHS